MIRLTADWLNDPGAKTVCRVLGDAGHQVFFVGGCVRNALLGAGTTDVDIATDAQPVQVMELAAAAGVNAIPTGIDHGTVTLVIDGASYEVTTFRRDVETDGRRAVVAFTDDMAEDARRRDFTMNALYADANGLLHDPLNGLPDLHARHIRFIDDPSQRIREDYLRILRFFRFYAWYGAPDMGLDVDGLAACAALQEGLDGISTERVTSETLKLLRAPDPVPAIAAMAQAGILTRILPGSDARALGPLVHFEAEYGVASDPISRLSALTPAPDLRLSKAQSRRLTRIGTAAREGEAPLALGYRLGVADGWQAALVQAALTEQLPASDLQLQIETGAAAVFPVKAADFAGRHSGPALGAALREGERRWITSGFTLSKADLLRP